MCNDLLGIYSNLLNLVGTIIAVLCILKLDFKKLSRAGTVEKISHPETDIFIQRRFALKGISIMTLGFIVSVINTFLWINVQELFLIILSTITISYLSIRYFNMEHAALLQSFDRYMKQNGKTSPLDVASNGDYLRSIKVPRKFKFDKYFK